MKNEYVVIIDAVQDHVVPGWKAAETGSQVVTMTADMRMLRQQQEPIHDGVNSLVRGFDARALAGHVKPDAVQFRLPAKAGEPSA